MTLPMCAPAPHGANAHSLSTPLFSNFRKMEQARKQVVQAVLECVVENRRFTYSDIFRHVECNQKHVRGVD